MNNDFRYTVEYFNNHIKKDIESWPTSIKSHFAHIIGLLITYGPDIGMPHSKAIGKGLYELRPKGREGIGRAFYCFLKGKRIIILHAFIKKTQKTPKKELLIARKRLNDVIGS